MPELWRARGFWNLQQSLRFAATHDFLTNLLNRSEILAALGRELSRSGREGKAATVMMADIDHFKRINDSLGHAAGDEVLKEVARRLKSDLRRTMSWDDTVAKNSSSFYLAAS